MKLYILKELETSEVRYYRLLSNLCESVELNYTNIHYVVHRKGLGAWSDERVSVLLSETVD
jgi:hypothetical protein